MASPSKSHPRPAALPSKSALPPPRDPQGIGETIGDIEHPDIEGHELAEQVYASAKHSWIEKNLGDKKHGSEPGVEWAHEEPEEEEEEQAAAQMEGRAEPLLGDSRPHCSDDDTPRIDRPSEGNKAHGGACRDSFEAEEQPRTTTQSFAGPSRAPNRQGHFHGTNFNDQLQLTEESISKEVAPGNL
ncbi:unnamed protein product [Clonostachys rhizophaga]|uniref:Uncharacterized protein n=1 Tax=Clonostachys rhizophaga TaxID=160324 RepID=A0A9N9YMZ5_9HYPO|nr:unnamed protein product [Clonostachys rhizophaga]